MKTVLKFSKGSRALYILAPLFKMLEAALELIVPLIVAELIDKGIIGGDRSSVTELCARLVIIAAAGLIFAVSAQYFAAKAAVTTVSKVKQSLFDKTQSLSFSQLDEIGGPTLITRLTADMDSVQNGINLTLRLLLRSPIVVIGACIMAYRVDGKSSLVFAVCVPLLCLAVFLIMFFSIPLYSKVRYRLDKLLVSVRESVTGARVIRAFNIENDIEDEFKDINRSLTSMQLFVGKISALMNPVTGAIVNVAIAALIYVGAIRVGSGYITAGAVVALYNYMSQILVELLKSANLIVTVSKAAASAGRIEEILKIEPEKEREIENSESDNYIEFRNVTFAYNEGSEPVLDNVSFTVNKGEKVGIIGSTGSGKTTLIGLLAGYYQPESGEIFIENKNVLSLGKEELSKLVSVAEQKPSLFSLSVKENLTIGLKNVSDERITDALKCADALDFVNEKEGGINCVCEQGGRNFSGGQRQRLSIARALLRNPEILVLDDSFSALDYLTEASVRAEIEKKTNSALFIVSQRTGSILGCDKIIFLESGKAFVGTHSELLKSNESYRQIHLTQFEEEAG